MAGVRVLVGTRKGGFVLTSDEKRTKWDVSGPHFSGWEVFHMDASPADPDRIYASPWTGWHGQVVQRSDDGGRSWTPVGNDFSYQGEAGTHLGLDGESHPFEFVKVWHLEPSPSDPDVVYAGVEDAALFKSTDAGSTWTELPALRTHRTAPEWGPGAGGLCLHTVLLDHQDPDRIITAISSAGVVQSWDGGKSFEPTNRGMSAEYMPDPDAETGFCVHKLAVHPSRQDTIFMQQHSWAWRSDDGGRNWTNINGNLPCNFGFVVGVHAHEPETVYVLPITSGEEHYPPDGKLRVYRSRTGGSEWEPLTKGLPQENCYVNVLRDAMAIDSLDECGVYFGTTGGQVYVSADSGDSWSPIVEHLPAVLSVEVQTLR